jgi:hypothetical protein
MGAACVRADDSNNRNTAGLKKRNSRMQYGDDSLTPSESWPLPAYVTLSRRYDDDENVKSSPPSRVELQSSSAEFYSSLLDIGRLTSSFLARYSRSLPRKPSYLQNDLGEHAYPFSSKARSQCFFDAALRSSVTEAQRSMRSPCGATQLLAQYS